MLKVWVSGKPATFATRGEAPWKKEIESSLLHCNPETMCATGVSFKFVLPAGVSSANHFPDIDNLCEPVFSVMVNKLGVFEGKRANVKWWCASKCQGETTGVELELHQENAPNMIETLGNPFFILQAPDNYFELNYQLKKGRIRSPEPEDRFIINLSFGSININIGDIATGKVKSIIDTLYPVIGGSKSRPEDWRIDFLQVEKDTSLVRDGSVEVRIWRKRGKKDFSYK